MIVVDLLTTLLLILRLSLDVGYNEERFWSTGMNPVAMGCSGNPEQSRIPVNRTGTRNLPRVPART